MRERKNSNDVVGMIRSLGILFAAIILRDYTTGSLTWQWTILMTAVLICLFVGGALVSLHQKSRT
jgi:hypothetical protein